MHLIRSLLILSVGMSGLLAQEPVKGAKPPVISADLRVPFWRAAAEVAELQLRLTQWQAKLNAARAALVASCGETFVVAEDATGEPICAVRPETPNKRTP